MNKTLQLYQKFGKFDETAQVLDNEEDIVVAIKWEQLKGSRVEAVINDKYVLPVRNNKFTINRSILKVGAVTIAINVYVNDILVKTFSCEELYVRETERTFEVIPELEALRNEVKSYNDKVNTLQLEVERLTELVSALYGFDVKGDK